MIVKNMDGQIESLDLLRAIAAVAVVVFHSSSTMARDDSLRILVAAFLNWCVPIFLMITGALFLRSEKHRPLAQIIRHNIVKVLIILGFWGFIYNFLSNVLIEHSFGIEIVWKSVKMVLIGDTSFCYQFWYLYVLVGLYLLIPIIKPWVNQNILENKITGEAKLFIMLFLVVSVVLPTFSKIVGNTEVLWKGAFLPFSVFFLYILLGHLLMSNGMSSVTRKVLYIFLAIQSILLIYLAITGKYKMADRLTGYSSIFTCNLSVVLFDAVQRIDLSKLARRIRSSYILIAEYSFGIYIFHVIVLQFLRKVGFTSDHINSVIFLLFTSIVALFSSIIGTLLCKKIPFLRRTV